MTRTPARLADEGPLSGQWPMRANMSRKRRSTRRACVDSADSAIHRRRAGHPAPPQLRRPSFAAEFGESRLDFFPGGKPALFGIAQTAIDACEFFRRRMIDAILDLGVDIESNCSQFLLPIRRPASTRSRTSDRRLVFMTAI